MSAIEQREARYQIGVKFKLRNGRGRKEYSREYTVTDIYRTYNSDGLMVKLRYVATHDFCGQKVTDYDVIETTIARNLNEEQEV